MQNNRAKTQADLILIDIVTALGQRTSLLPSLELPSPETLAAETCKVRLYDWLTDWSVHLLPADMDHGTRRRHEIGLADVMAFFFLRDDTPDELG